MQSRQQSRALALEKDDGRVQAYGWSLPSKFLMSSASCSSDSSSGGVSSSASLSTHIAVPVPVYCRPVSDVAGVKVNVTWLFNMLQHSYGITTAVFTLNLQPTLHL